MASPVPAFSILALALSHLGTVGDLLSKSNPAHGFNAEDPILSVVRAEKLDKGACSAWTHALETLSNQGVRWPNFKGWEPWNEFDSGTVANCDDFPCDTKVSEPEAALLKKAPKEKRAAVYESIVEARVKRYQKDQSRKEYEFPGALTDPWAYQEKIGFKSTLTRPNKISLWMKRLELAPGKMQVVRQVMDRRFASNAHEAMYWQRDLSTDHYFDGWGEWIQFVCNSSGQGGVLLHALTIELDLLKRSDLISKISQGAMKSNVDEAGSKYLDDEAARLKSYLK